MHLSPARQNIIIKQSSTWYSPDGIPPIIGFTHTHNTLPGGIPLISIYTCNNTLPGGIPLITRLNIHSIFRNLLTNSESWNLSRSWLITELARSSVIVEYGTVLGHHGIGHGPWSSWNWARSSVIMGLGLDLASDCPLSPWVLLGSSRSCW